MNKKNSDVKKEIINRRFWKIIFRDFLLAFLAIFIFLAIIPIVTYIYYAQDLTSKENLMNRNDTGVILLDKNGIQFFNFYEAKNRKEISLLEIPQHMQDAVVAIEDREFYLHQGISFRGIVRSIIKNISKRNLESGGSTITQQLVKNSLLNPKKSFLRKSQEVILAYEMEKKFTKRAILEMYLNSVYFGEGAFGLEQAAQAYFNKSAKDLTLSESALLAALLPSPSRLSPYSGNYEELRERQKIVLQKMAEQRYITDQQKTVAEAEQVTFQRDPDTQNSVAFHFALMVEEELLKKYKEEDIARSGYQVKTTLDLNWQKIAEAEVKKQVESLAKNKVTNGAVVVIDPRNGEVRALVGSKDWFDDKFGKVNVATARRQPGSAFKPIVYSAALEKNVINMATVLKDQPIAYGANGHRLLATRDPQNIYRPKNYDNKFRGQVLVRRALANSLNVPAVEVISKLGVGSAVAMANRLGLNLSEEVSAYGLSLVLGAGEVRLLDLTNAYATFANNGKSNQVTTILDITNKKGENVYHYNPEQKQVIDPEYTFLISSILSDNKARAEVFGKALTISRPAAVKTGTTENYHDAWTLGYTPSLAIGVWVGNNDGALMDSVAGSLGPAPIWKNLMEQYLVDTPVENFEQPAKIKKVRICSNGGILKQATSFGTIEYFVEGAEPKIPCEMYTPAPTSQPQPENEVHITYSNNNNEKSENIKITEDSYVGGITIDYGN